MPSNQVQPFVRDNTRGFQPQGLVPTVVIDTISFYMHDITKKDSFITSSIKLTQLFFSMVLGISSIIPFCFGVLRAKKLFEIPKSL